MHRALKTIAIVASAAVLLGTGSSRVLAAAPAVSLSPRSGPPTTNLLVNGSGYAAFEAVDVYFDSQDMVLASASSAGSFSIHLHVPSAAQPGAHFVTAIGRASGMSAQATFTVVTRWVAAGFNAGRTGFNPYENTVTASNVSGLVGSWSFATSGAVESSPAIVNGSVFVGSDDGDVYALNASTGALRWSVATGGPVKSSPAVAGGVVYVGSEDGKVYALKATDGSTVWVKDFSSLEAKGFDSSPVVSGGIVYIGGTTSNVYALDAAIGFPHWATPGTSTCGGWSSPSLAGATVFVDNLCDGMVYAFNAANGTQNWAAGFGATTPSVVNGRVFTGVDEDIEALNAHTGGQLWFYAFSDGQQFGTPAVTAGQVYLNDTTGMVSTLTASAGTLGWHVSEPNASSTDTSASSPALAAGVLYVGSHNGSVYALNPTDGSELWSAATGGPVHSSPAIVNGMVYVGSDDGSVYAYGLAVPPAAVTRPSPSTLHPNLRLVPQRSAG